MYLIPPPRGTLRGLTEHWPRARLAIQTAIAAGAAYGVAATLALPQGYWAVVTAMLVVQANVGASLGLAVDRLLATLLGAATGGLVLAVFGDSPAIIGPLLVACVAGLTFVAAQRPSLRLAPVTAVIVILADLQTGSALASAVNRVVEIGVGAVIAVAVSMLVFPSRAGQTLAQQVGRILPVFAEHLRGTIDAALGTERTEAEFIALNAKTRVALGAAETLVKEAQREIAGHIANHADPAAVVRTMRRLWYTQMMAARAARQPLPEQARAVLGPSLLLVRDAAPLAIEAIGTSYREGTEPPGLEAVERALAALNASVVALRQSGVMRDMTTEDVAQIFSLTFALSQIGQNLRDLADRYADLQGRFAE